MGHTCSVSAEYSVSASHFGPRPRCLSGADFQYSATICSIFKTVELRTIFTTQDPTWDGVDITIWSQAELSLGILIASLPPLRKALISVFQRILPSTLTGSRKTPLYGQGYGQGHSASGNVIMDNLRGSKAYHSRIHGESVLDADDDSDRAILEEGTHTGSGIMKSMTVTVKKASAEPSISGGEPQAPWPLATHMSHS